MIRYVVPYDINGNLNRAYNKEIYRGGGYVAFQDRDVMWLDPQYAKKIHSIVQENHGNYFTCYTNRINCTWQRWHTPGNDIEKHIGISKFLWDRFGSTVEDHTGDQLWSGHLMICPTDDWIKLERDGLLGQDNQIHLNARELGKKVLLMKGIYVYHYYSNYDGPWETASRDRDKSHLI